MIASHAPSRVDLAGQLADLFESAGDTERSAWTRLIQQRLALPQAYVTVVGETSTGKSSLINALLSQPLLPVGGKPTTGIVTHLACRTEPEPRMLAIYRDATQEEIEAPEFKQFSLNPPGELLRLQARITPRDEQHVGLHVFDTPGYNAMVTQHEEVLMNFLPQSDVIVFVVGHRTGFGQKDQDLFEAVASATAHDRDIPLMLVINRAPFGCSPQDKRVAEIRRLAEDGMKRPMTLHIIASTNVRQPNGLIERQPMAADGLWNDVRDHALNPARIATVQRKLEQQLLQLIEDAEAEAERREISASASADQFQRIEQQLGPVHRVREESLREIDLTMTRLEKTLPAMTERMLAIALTRMNEEIHTSNKWLGKAECTEWIVGHCLPFEVQAIGKAIEEHITVEMDALNRRLEDLANTAISELNKTIALPEDDPVRRFVLNVSSTIGQRLAGNAINSALRGLGGVGGAAAGAGNLVKMVVKRAGALFGKTFSREVYAQIGRIFTKKMIARLTIALQVVVESIGFLHDASTWQDELADSSRNALAEWKEECVKELLEQQIPEMRQASINLIEDTYADLCRPRHDSQTQGQVESIRMYRQQLAQLRHPLQSLQPSAC